MSETVKTHNTACTSEAHTEHLCYLVAKDWHLRNRDEYKAMVQNAQYRCKRCERTAANAQNLCEPTEL